MNTTYTNVWRRVFAYIIDGALMLTIMGLIAYVAYKAFAPTSTTQEDNMRILSMMMSLSTILVLLVSQTYEIIMTKKYQATLGKLAVKVKVTDLGGNPLTWGRSAARSLIKVGHVFLAGLIADFFLKSTSTGIQQKLTALGNPPTDKHAALMLALGALAIGILSFIISMAGNWIALFNGNRQTLHDLMAGTFVVKR